jgi:hypothetical protein
MRLLVLVSVVVLILGLALGLLNLYIVGRIDGPALFAMVGLVAVVSAFMALAARRK